MCVNPRKSNVSGRVRPSRLASCRANRPNRSTRVFSGCSSRPNVASREARAFSYIDVTNRGNFFNEHAHDIAAQGGTETRPVNAAVNYLVKY